MSQGTTPTSDVEQQIAAAKALAEAQKAMYEAQKAAAEAQTAALKAAVGEIPASGFTGAVELKEGAGKLEAALLATKATREASAAINKAVRAGLGTRNLSNLKIVLFAAGDMPTFQNLIAYEAQFAVVNRALEVAIEHSEKLGDIQEVRTLAGVGVALEAMSKIMSYFRADYSVGGVELTLDDVLLVNGVAASLIASKDAENRDQTTIKVFVPGIYNPDAISLGGTKIMADLGDLATRKQRANRRAKAHSDAADAYTKESAAQANEELKKKLLAQAQKHKEMAEELKAAIAVHDAWFGKLSALDDKGAIPLASVIREQSILKAITENVVLIVKIQKAGGGYYIKKNFWTFFGGMPLYFMGGVSASYTLLDGKAGNVLAAGTVPIYGEVTKAGELRTYLSK